MIVKGIVSAINNDDKTISVILPEYNVVTRPIKAYSDDIFTTLKVDDFVLVVIFNNDFNDCMVLSSKECSNLTDIQLANIDAVPNKADKTEVSNSVKETARGRTIVLKDISPLTDNLYIKVTGYYTPKTKVYMMGQNVWNDNLEYYDEQLYSDYIQVVSGAEYYLYCDFPTLSMDGESGGIFKKITYYDSNKQELSELPVVTPTFAYRNSLITIPEGCSYITVVISSALGKPYYDDIYLYETISYSNNEGNVTIPAPFESVITLATVDVDTSLECEYNKDINGVLEAIENRLASLEALLGGI